MHLLIERFAEAARRLVVCVSLQVSGVCLLPGFSPWYFLMLEEKGGGVALDSEALSSGEATEQEEAEADARRLF
jgi:hypothetical protein